MCMANESGSSEHRCQHFVHIEIFQFCWKPLLAINHITQSLAANQKHILPWVGRKNFGQQKSGTWKCKFIMTANKRRYISTRWKHPNWTIYPCFYQEYFNKSIDVFDICKGFYIEFNRNFLQPWELKGMEKNDICYGALFMRNAFLIGKFVHENSIKKTIYEPILRAYDKHWFSIPSINPLARKSNHSFDLLVFHCNWTFIIPLLKSTIESNQWHQFLEQDNVTMTELLTVKYKFDQNKDQFNVKTILMKPSMNNKQSEAWAPNAKDWYVYSVVRSIK